jgi:putative peptide zinc metalloprotease protein
MPETAGTFSESWYRIADQHAALRPHLAVRRQFYRGERWYVIADPMNNQFFRVLPAAYDFLARLRLDRTVEEAWRECLALHPDDAPGQEDVIRLLGQLYTANLLHSDMPADSPSLFERYRQRREREVQSRLLSIMFARIPLLDPDAFLRRFLPIARAVLSPIGAGLWFLVVGAGIKVAIDHATALREASQNILAPDNLFLLYAGFIGLKTIHEFGHAFMCRRFGGEVHVMGVMFMIFTPMPYVDATSAWAFRSRWHRVLVGAAGMIPELFVAALMTFVWANTGAGTLHSLAYNIMFIASVSTVLFNANPLMRFDGYYILSDLLDIPNLYGRANQQLVYLVERYAFGCPKSESPAHSRREACWLALFGIAGHIYRVCVFGVILFFLAGRFLILGLIMAVVCGIAWVVVPAVRLVQYLAACPRLDRKRVRAVGVCAGIGAAALVLLGIIPFPDSFRAPGVLQAVGHTIVVNEAPGYLQAVLASPNREVKRGEALVRLRDPELAFELAEAQAELDGAEAMERRAIQNQSADLMPIRSRVEAIRQHLALLQERRAELTVRAKQDGQWIAPELDRLSRGWLARGTELGHVIDERAYYFSAVVPEDEASRLFAHQIRSAQVRLHGQAGRTLPVVGQEIIPAEHEMLPSEALGWNGGGEVAVKLDDPTGLRAAEPFFELRARVHPAAGVAILYGRSGQIRFTVAPEPLLRQWARKLEQLLQQHYGL